MTTGTGGPASSDFLSRLARRAIGSANAIEPRLPSLFEPQPGFSPVTDASGGGRGAAPEDDAIEERETLEWIPPARLAGHIPPAATGARVVFPNRPAGEGRPPPLLAKDDRTRPDVNHGNRVADSVHGAQHIFGVDAGVASNHPRATPERPPSANASAALEPPMNLDNHHSTQTSGDAPRFGRVHGASTGRSRSASVVAAPVADPRPQLRREHGLTTHTPEEAPRDGAVHPVASGPRATHETPDGRAPPHAAATDHFAAPPPAGRWRPNREAVEAFLPPAPEHVVNITIGRVDVRAAVDATPAKPAAAKTGRGPLGLDDYLKRRAGGQ